MEQSEISQKTTDFMHKLGSPRYLGTIGEQKAVEQVKNEFAKIPRIITEEQSFSVSNWYMSRLLNYLHPFLGISMIILFVVNYFAYYAPALVIGAILFFLSLFNRQIVFWFQFRIQKFGKQIPAKNLIFSMNPANKTQENLIFLAHTDSISHTIPPILEGLGYFAGFIGGMGFAIHNIIFSGLNLFINNIFLSKWQLIWGIPIACITFIELFNQKGNNSLGILDDLSGIGQLYHLAHTLSADPLKNTKIWFIATGAEELGDYGAFYFLKKYQQGLPKAHTRFVIVDSIGTKTKNGILYGISYPVRHYSPYMERLAQELMKTEKTPLKLNTIPPLLQVASDHVPVDNAGYEFLFLMSSDFVIHGKKDNWNALDRQNFDTICQFLVKFVRKYDSQMIH